jgi:predicted GNAT superfamily acetyltransferase
MRIRPLESQQDYMAAEEFQRKVWGFADREINPLNELVVAQRIGGFVFGAFDSKDRLVGFCFGVPGYLEGKVYHYSRMNGVLPDCQDRGLGTRLKLYQRDFVLKQQLSLIRWTFDPLQSRNAQINIQKLGCVISEYVENIYAGSTSRFNAGLETDRFVVEWWIQTPRVDEHLAGEATPWDLEDVLSGNAGDLALTSVVTLDGFRAPDEVHMNLRSRRVLVEIPSDLDALKAKDLALARKWRSVTRKIFQNYFKRGYQITEFTTGLDQWERRGFYLLQRGSRLP